MLRIEEIVGAMDDEFRILLDGLDDDRLTALKADAKALRRLRPVGVSQTEAQAMIQALQQTRARKAASQARQDRRRRIVEGIQARRAPLSSRRPPEGGGTSTWHDGSKPAPLCLAEIPRFTRDDKIESSPRRRPLLLLAGAVALVLIALLASR